MKRTIKIIFTSLILLAAGCAHSIHQAQVSDFRPKVAIETGDIVKTEREQFVILGFVGNSDYVDLAYRDLQAKCTDGQLTSISTIHLTSLGFFSWTNKVRMQGLCLKAN